MIRVLLASKSDELENAIRSSGSLEFAGRVDPFQLNSDLPGDVLLVDLDDANESDWRALGALPVPVLLLFNSSESQATGAALRSGIRGVISSDATPQEIEGAVHAVHAGLIVTMPATLNDLLPNRQSFDDDLAEPLSERELEVLGLVAEGLSNRLIAQALNISEHTVKTHVASIFAKLGASSRTEAVSQALRKGLVML